MNMNMNTYTDSDTDTEMDKNMKLERDMDKDTDIAKDTDTETHVDTDRNMDMDTDKILRSLTNFVGLRVKLFYSSNPIRRLQILCIARAVKLGRNELNIVLLRQPEWPSNYIVIVDKVRWNERKK